MSYQYDYNAEATGHVIGLRRGYEQGFEAGEVEGWNKAVRMWNTEVETRWNPFVDRLTAERDEAIRARDELLEKLRHAAKQTHKWHNAFYSVLCALDSAMDVLEHAPQDMRTQMILSLAKRAEHMKSEGWIDSLPQDNSVMRTRASLTVDKLQKWWDQVRHLSKKAKAAEADRGQSPSP
jgi:hypothetical protein